MAEHIRERIIANVNDCKTKPIMCAMEKVFRSIGFVVLRDSSTTVNELTHEPPALFTRVLRLKLDGAFVTTWGRFTYDLRDRWAEMEISNVNLENLDHQMAEKHTREMATLTPEEQALRESHQIA